MRRLSHKATQELIATMESLCAPQTWDQWYDEHNGNDNAIVEFPSGELMNDAIRGFVWAWGMQKRIASVAIEKGDRFDANGLEGKCQVQTTLTTALLVYRALPTHRCQIRM